MWLTAWLKKGVLSAGGKTALTLIGERSSASSPVTAWVKARTAAFAPA